MALPSYALVLLFLLRNLRQHAKIIMGIALLAVEPTIVQAKVSVGIALLAVQPVTVQAKVELDCEHCFKSSSGLSLGLLKLLGDGSGLPSTVRLVFDQGLQTYRSAIAVEDLTWSFWLLLLLLSLRNESGT